MKDNTIIEDKEFEELLADQQARELRSLYDMIRSSLKSRDEKDEELIKLMRIESASVEQFVSKLNHLSTPTIEPKITVNNDMLAAAIVKSTEILLLQQQKTNELLKQLIEVRSADVVLYATRDAVGLIEKVTAKIVYK